MSNFVGQYLPSTIQTSMAAHLSKDMEKITCKRAAESDILRNRLFSFCRKVISYRRNIAKDILLNTLENFTLGSTKPKNAIHQYFECREMESR